MPDTSEQDSVRAGIISAILAYTMWGIMPLYFFATRDTPATEILIHRAVWAVPAGALIIALRHQWPEVIRGITTPRVMMYLCASTVVIATTWLIFIYAVQAGNTMEASLGYYITPLMYVAVGIVLLGERLRRKQIISVALAFIGVTMLAINGGHFPFVALSLAVSFTTYGYLRKRVDVGAMPGLFIETGLMLPIAAIAYVVFAATGETGFEAADPAGKFLLTLAGPLTVLPLLFFAIGTRRLTLATLGFIQFIGPSLQFIMALIDGEPFTPARQLCFAFIWTSAAVFAWDAWSHRPQKSAQKS